MCQLKVFLTKETKNIKSKLNEKIKSFHIEKYNKHFKPSASYFLLDSNKNPCVINRPKPNKKHIVIMHTLLFIQFATP